MSNSPAPSDANRQRNIGIAVDVSAFLTILAALPPSAVTDSIIVVTSLAAVSLAIP